MVTDAPTLPPDGVDIALAPTRRAIGRPPVQIDPAAVRELARKGLTVDQVADRLKISRRCMYARMSTDPVLRAAMDSGVSEGIDFAASKLFEQIEAGVLTAIIFFLRSKGKWHSAPDEVNLNVRQFQGSAPTIDGHVYDLMARHTELLDSPDPDDVVDAEWTAVEDAPDAEPADATLAAMME